MPISSPTRFSLVHQISPFPFRVTQPILTALASLSLGSDGGIKRSKIRKEIRGKEREGNEGEVSPTNLGRNQGTKEGSQTLTLVDCKFLYVVGRRRRRPPVCLLLSSPSCGGGGNVPKINSRHNAFLLALCQQERTERGRNLCFLAPCDQPRQRSEETKTNCFARDKEKKRRGNVGKCVIRE